MKKCILLLLPALALVGCSKESNRIDDFQKCNYVNISGVGNFSKLEPLYYTVAKYRSNQPLKYYSYGDNKDEIYVTICSSTPLTACPTGSGHYYSSTPNNYELTKIADAGVFVSYIDVYYSTSKRIMKRFICDYEWNSGTKEFISELKGKYVFLGSVYGTNVSVSLDDSYCCFQQLYETIYTDVGTSALVTYQLYTAPTDDLG